jgi:cytoskeletal protein RodZ/predicted O-methyltransferase YrrM
VVALAFNYYRRNPAAAAKLLRDPVGAWWRIYDRAGMYLDRRRPRHPYQPKQDWEARLQAWLGMDPDIDIAPDFRALWPEIVGLLEAGGFRTGPESFFSGNDGDPEFVRAIWHVTRTLRPKKIVETGVAHGVSTRFILEALKRNDSGQLWSIDLAPTDPAIAAEIGVAARGCCPDRWTLIEGSSRRRLPRLLTEIGPIDLFIHDSLHTTPNLRFELETVWPALRRGGYIVVDDIDTNSAFHDFLAAHRDAAAIICQSEPIRPDRRRPDQRGLFGIIRKRDPHARLIYPTAVQRDTSTANLPPFFNRAGGLSRPRPELKSSPMSTIDPSPEPQAEPSPEPQPEFAADETPRRHKVGGLLRRTREGQGLELAAVAKALKLRAPYLEAIERGDYDVLPGPVYAIGFVRAYAEYLGLDGAEAVRRFKREEQVPDTPSDLNFPVPITERSIPGGRILVTALVLAVCGYGLWYYVTQSSHSRPELVTQVPASLAQPTDDTPPPAAPEKLSAVGSSLAATPTQPPAPPAAATPATVAVTAAPNSGSPPAGAASATPASPAPPPPAALAVAAPVAPTMSVVAPPAPGASNTYGVIDGPSRIIIRVTKVSWVEIRDARHGVIFQKLLHPGDVYRAPNTAGLTLHTGYSDGLAITVDSTPVAIPHNSSEVRSLDLDPERLKVWASQAGPVAAAPAPKTGGPAPQ